MKSCLYILFAFIFSSCCSGFALCMDTEPVPDYIYIKNASNDSVFVYMALGIGPEYPTLYPDTTLPPYLIIKNARIGKERKDLFITDYLPVLPPNTTGEVWPTDYEKIAEWEPDTMSIFIISKNAVDKYGWEDVRENYRILERYDLSTDEVILMNYTIPYPPQPFMRNMKMYPPYSRFIQ